ncbi:MAG: sugar ABC transporter ATP-binding protein [Ignavibacteriales bacterium]|nr:sugar ABC transporter ATP-binding protein [Ignavibacteriales bacterium]
MAPIVEFEHITKRFGGTTALDAVSFSIRKGEIHALMGENGAGKSTLMKILSGVLSKDSGSITVAGTKTSFKNAVDAQHEGISTVYQEPHLVPHMTVAENIFLGREPTRMPGFVDFNTLNARTKETLARLELNISPTTTLADLSPADIQLVQIARAIAFSTKILVLDEPTASITEHETEILFDLLKKLNAGGLTVLYVSHRLKEIFELCHRASVLRDGHYVGTVEVATTTEKEIIKMMVGRDLKEMPAGSERKEPSDVKLNVQGMSVSESSIRVRNVSFNVRKGEIVALAGLVGSGRSEVAKTIFGLHRMDSGTIEINGSRVEIRNPEDAIRRGISLVPEDRKGEGLISIQSVKHNISLTGLRLLSRLGFINGPSETTLARTSSAQFSIKSSSEEAEVSTLSGGNQQKVVLAKWLWLKPTILMLDEPTRGIDVGAKAEIHHLIIELARSGVAVVLISSELPEVLRLADRIYVMRDGTITGELQRSDASQEAIMHLAAIGIKESARA